MEPLFNNYWIAQPPVKTVLPPALDEKDVTPMAHCIEIDRDCAELCYTAAKLLTRDSEFAHELLALCEKACRHCAEECGKHKDEHCKKCAEKCLECAEACHAHHGKVQLN